MDALDAKDQNRFGNRFKWISLLLGVHSPKGATWSSQPGWPIMGPGSRLGGRSTPDWPVVKLGDKEFKSNCRQFIFQWIWIHTKKSIQFEIWWHIRSTMYFPLHYKPDFHGFWPIFDGFWNFWINSTNSQLKSN